MTKPKKDLIDIVRDAGIVGAGGAGFPTHIKYNTEVEYIIANGAECEPLLRVDQQLMDRYAKEIVNALLAVKERVKARVAIIGLKGKYKAAIQSLKKAANDRVKISILENVYPAGDEQVLVYETTGRIVPEGGIPLNVGVVVSNIATLLWVADSLDGKSVTHRWLTITGAVKEPMTIKVPVGTSYAEVLAAAGGATIADYRIIVGGPMMGCLAGSVNETVKKTTSGLIVLPADHYAVNYKYFDLNLHIKTSKAACCQCTFCTTVCPRYLIGHALEPHKVMAGISFGVTTSARHAPLAFLCCECQLCYFACPMHLAPGRINALLKQQLAKAGIKNPHNRRPTEPHLMRKYRLQPVSRLVSQLGLQEYDVPAPIKDIEIKPKQVNISLRQHLGKPALAMVKEGQRIKCGELIGKAQEGVSANVHCSIDGIVKSVQGEEIIVAG